MAKVPDDDEEGSVSEKIQVEEPEGETDTVAKASGVDTDSESAVPDSETSSEKVAKKRTWRKPKDKPKRPLSAYNIFFQHARSRIVEDQTEEATTDEIVRSIESILSKSREKRRHRKSHGRISFGDLARAIADQWKNINPKHKEIFDHYAEIDMIRYRRELKVWKERKELESEANALARHSSFVNTMNNSFNSNTTDEINIDSLPDESDSSASKLMSDSFNASHSSLGSYSSAERRRMHSNSMNMMIQRQQQILRQQLRDENSNFMMASRTAHSPSQSSYNSLPGTNAFHQSFSSMPSRFSDFEEPMADFQQAPTMEQLQLQQERQLEQMRQLQLQQRLIQQQIEIQRNHLQLTSGMTNMNRAHSSFSDIMSQPVMTPHQNQMQFQASTFGHSSLEQSMNLGEALLTPSVHVSDYSNSGTGHHSSSGFGGSRSFAMSHSDSMTASSFQGSIPSQITNRQVQASNSFTGQLPVIRSQPSQGLGGFNFSNNDEQQHDLRRMMDMDG